MYIGIDGNEANVGNKVGSGRYAYEILSQFSKDKANNYLIYLKNSPGKDFPKQTENFKHKVFGPPRLWTQFSLPLRLTFGNRPEVFFSLAHYGPRFSMVPYVVTIHDLSYLHFPEFFKKSDLIQLRAWSKYSINNSAAIIAPSQSTKDDIVKNYNVSASKVTVVYEGYDQKRFKPQKKESIKLIKKRYGIDDDYLIFVGTLQPRKNVELLISAFSNILKFRKNLKLVIVGKTGWLYDSILEKSKKMGIVDEEVIFTGFVPDADLPGLISGAKVYINPSLWEGFGIPVVEAQACGVPVVASNVSSLPEIVGDSGLLFDPEKEEDLVKAIEMLLNKQDLAEAYIRKGYANIKRFSWEKCAKDTLSILTKVASSKNP